MKNPERLFVGPREAVITEYGGLAHIYPGKYLVQPDGEGNYDAEGADTKVEMKDLIEEYKKIYPGIEVYWC